MEENEAISIRPWTIKWAAGILVSLMLYGNLYSLYLGTWKAITLVGAIISIMFLFAIWHGRRWARNILFAYLLFSLPLLVAGSGIYVLNSEKAIGGSAVFGLIMIVALLIAVFLTFMKTSNDWFATVNGEVPKEEKNTFSWNFQLTLIGVSLGLGAIVMAVHAKLNLLPLGREMMLNMSTYGTRLAVLVGFESLGFLIGVMMIVFPFTVILGYWKNTHHGTMSRLITLGTVMPLLAFPVGKTLFLFSLFFFSKVVIVGAVVYLSLCVGQRIAQYVERLKRPVGIKY